MPKTFGPSVPVALRSALNFPHAYTRAEINESLADACADAGLVNLHNLSREKRYEIVKAACEILIENYGVRMARAVAQ